MADLGVGPVASAPTAGDAGPAPPSKDLSGNLGFGAVASGSVANAGSGVAGPSGDAGTLGFGAVSSAAVAGNQSSGSSLTPVSNPAVVAPASARTSAAASFIATGSGGPVRASQVVMEVLLPAPTTAKLRPFVQINT